MIGRRVSAVVSAVTLGGSLYLGGSLMTAAPVAAAVPVTSDGGTRVPCEYEDSTGCVWDARHMGNGIGRSFVVRPSGRLVFVSHARAHYLLTGVIV